MRFFLSIYCQYLSFSSVFCSVFSTKWPALSVCSLSVVGKYKNLWQDKKSSVISEVNLKYDDKRVFFRKNLKTSNSNNNLIKGIWFVLKTCFFYNCKILEWGGGRPGAPPQCSNGSPWWNQRWTWAPSSSWRTSSASLRRPGLCRWADTGQDSLR